MNRGYTKIELIDRGIKAEDIEKYLEAYHHGGTFYAATIDGARLILQSKIDETFDQFRRRVLKEKAQIIKIWNNQNILLESYLDEG